MPCSITCSTKILTLAITTVLFILHSWRPLQFCDGARCVHFTIPSGRRGALLFPRARMYTFSIKFIKTIILLSSIYANIFVELEQTQTMNSTVLWCL